MSFTNSISYPTLQPINHEEHQPRRTKPKPRNHEEHPNLETQKSRRTKHKLAETLKPKQKPTNNKTQTMNKKKKNQRGGNSEGDGDDWNLDSCSWFSLGFWVRDSWCLLVFLRELVSCFLIFLSWCLPTDVREWEMEWVREYGWEIKYVSLDYNLNKIEFNWLNFSNNPSLLHSIY